MAPLIIPDGSAYALIALPAAGVPFGFPSTIKVADGVHVTTEVPVDLPDHWKSWLGSIATSRIKESQLCLIATEPVQPGQTGDGAEERCFEEAYHLFWGLYVSGRFSTGGAPDRVSGRGGPPQDLVKTNQVLDGLIETPGVETDYLSEQRLREAHGYGRRMRELSHKAKPDEFQRWRRTMLAFTSAARSADAATRVHEYVRVIEGFIRPDIGATEKQFKSRTELFVGPSQHELMSKLFGVRSAVEHLHGAFAAVTGETGKDQAMEVLKHALEAEAVARHCIRRFLDRPELWPHFANDDALTAFWALSPTERVALWGQPLDLKAVSGSFNPQYVPEDSL